MKNITKNCKLDIRISEADLQLIQRTAEHFEMSVPKFVLAVLIPYCCKIEDSEKEEK